MNPEDNPDEPHVAPDSSSENQESEVYQAELATTPTDESTTPANDNENIDWPQASAVPGEQLWKDSAADEPSEPKPPYLRSTFRAKLCFGLALVASLSFLVWFCAEEFRIRRNGLLIVRYSLLIIFVLLGNIAGLVRIQRTYIPSDARWSTWTALSTSLLCFLFIFPERWSWICLAWTLCQIPPFIANAFAPRLVVEDQNISFNINDSVAANGGSVASLVLGIWSIAGALFTSLSMINSVLGILLGLWGLSSRKKTLAVFGIVLCVLGIMACMLNVTYVFWEMLLIEEEELMQSAQ